MNRGVAMAAPTDVVRVDDVDVRLRVPRKGKETAGAGRPRSAIVRESELVDLDDSGDDEAAPSTAGEADDERTEADPGYVLILPDMAAELGEAAVNTYRQSLCLDESLSEEEHKNRKKGYKLKKIAEELVTTEKLYCESLDKMASLEKRLKARFLSSQESSLLFGNLEALVNLHGNLYSDLISHVPEPNKWDPSRVELETAVLRIAQSLAATDFLAAYGPYCANHPAQLSALAGRAADSEFLAALDAWQRSDGSKLPLNSYLLKPVQRILKYPLLVEELFRAAPEGSALQDTLSETCSLLQAIAQDANKTKRKHELETMMVGNVMVVRGLTLSDKLKAGGFEGDVASFGPLIDEAAGLSMTLSARRTSRKPKQRSLFLFRNVLLSCKAYDDRRITVKKVFPIGDFSTKGTKRTLEITEKGASAKHVFNGLNGVGWAAQIDELRSSSREDSAIDRSQWVMSPAHAGHTPSRSASFTSAVERLAKERTELQRRNEELLKEQERLLKVQAAADEQQRAVVQAQQEAIAAKERELEREAQKRALAEELLELQRVDGGDSTQESSEDVEVALAVAAPTSPGLSAPAARPAAATPSSVERAEREFETILAMRRRGVRAMIWNESEVPQDVIDSVNIESLYCLQFPLHSPSCHFDRYAVRGYLVKRGNFRKTWSTRWFVLSLTTKYLSYYSSSDAVTLRGSIPITNICTVVRADSLAGEGLPSTANVMHIVTLDRTYHLMAPDRDTLDAWVYGIGLMLKE